MKSTAGRVTAYLFALLHLVVVGAAPIADAAVERNVTAIMLMAEGAGHSDPAPERDTPVHLHEGCVFCSVISAAADQPWGIVASISTRTCVLREPRLALTPAPRPAVAIARTRAPPTPSSQAFHA
jgi:hypothetical protein